MATATARFSSTTGDGAIRASSSYSAAISAQSVAAGRGSRGVAGGDRCLHLVGPRLVALGGRLQQGESLVDLVAVPARAVLVLERDDVAGGVDPGGAARRRAAA